MKIPRTIIAILIIGLGATQAWDSNVLAAPSWVIALVALAVALPALAVVITDDPGMLLAAIIGMSLLLLAAKLMSPVPLPALLVVAMLAGVLVIIANQQGSDVPRRPGDE